MNQHTPQAARARASRLPGLAVATTLTCFMLAACGSASNPPAPPAFVTAPAPAAPVAVSVRDSAEMATVSLPIERYLLTPAQNADVNHAMLVLSGQCMRSHGLSFTVPPALTGQWAGSEVARRYGPTDLGQAQRYGYHNPPASDPTAATEKSASISADCRSEALHDLDGGQAQSSQSQGTAEEIDLQSYQSSAHSTYVIAAEATWSECMTGHGHRYRTPGDAFNDPAWRSSSTASQAEIATAVDDIECKWQTNLIGVWVGVETRIQDTAIAQHQAELDLERRQNSQELTVAARVDGR